MELSTTPASCDSSPTPDWSVTFVDYLQSRFHGKGLEALVKAKPEVSEMARHFGGNHMPPDALEVAKIAHLAELAYHLNLRPNIMRALGETFGETIRDITSEQWESDPELMPVKYTFGLIKDFPVIADFAKAHEEKAKRAGVEYVDIEGLVALVEKVNFESIIIKSALDYSNFLLLNEKENLSEQEKAKMKQVVTAIKTVDSPLLALTGFDALEAEILSKAYTWELEQSGDDYFVKRSIEAFDKLGGRVELVNKAEFFLEELFAADKFQHGRVTFDQENYDVFFTDGSIKFDSSENEFRLLARLKSVGSTAKKMHALYKKSKMLETPMDIIGTTLIAKDKQHMLQCLEGTMERLAVIDVSYQAAPSRSEQVHIKGSDEFLSLFGADSELYNGLSAMDEHCSNGYEAVKLTFIYEGVPIEIQITHETARKESRVGLGSHTLFKLMKLAKECGDMSIRELSTEALLERFQRISIRKDKFNKSSYETNGRSTVRADYLRDYLQNESFDEHERRSRAVGNLAVRR